MAWFTRPHAHTWAARYTDLPSNWNQHNIWPSPPLRSQVNCIRCDAVFIQQRGESPYCGFCRDDPDADSSSSDGSEPSTPDSDSDGSDGRSEEVSGLSDESSPSTAGSKYSRSTRVSSSSGDDDSDNGDMYDIRIRGNNSVSKGANQMLKHSVAMLDLWKKLNVIEGLFTRLEQIEA